MKLMQRSDRKELMEVINRDYNCNIKELFKGGALFIDEERNVYLVNRDIEKIDLKSFRIKTAGLVIGGYDRGFIFTVEGSQLLKEEIKKVIELNNKQIQDWVKGKDLSVKEENGFYLLKFESDIYGAGIVINGTLKNSLDKFRAVKEELY